MIPIIIIILCMQQRYVYSIDISIDESSRKDICDNFGVIFKIRKDGTYYQFYMFLNWSAPLGKLITPTGYIRYPWMMNISRTDPEYLFFLHHQDYMDRYYNETFENVMSFTMIYECEFSPFRCSVRQVYGLHELVYYDGNNTFIYPMTWPRNMVLASNDTLIQKANGSGINILENRATDLERRWRRMCRTLQSLDDPHKVSYELVYLKGSSIHCTAISNIPVKYSVIPFGEHEIKTTFETTYYIGEVAFIVAYTANVTESDIMCQVRSPTGWVANVSYMENSERSSTITPLDRRSTHFMNTTWSYRDKKTVSHIPKRPYIIPFFVLSCIIMIWIYREW
nr:membrane protein b153 [Mastomys natalensis cytomegalovirus 3]WEG69969.1 membrane protein b153 [Mastomys natalensis cytomegalovirus 3]WEG70109.1 membrane protein b153 [Mastomys natalensis cytomegalovirus 3]WEG70249.1 membrane protein b153 [Mastomys natalensis cytomegalovirus 3]WEG70389.1 membrane protein b153 [Mastomys natalensis cytomegalovirus 3]